MNQRSYSIIQAAGLASLLLGVAPCFASEAQSAPLNSDLEGPVLKCYEDYAKRYSATSAAPADIASAAYAHCHDSLTNYTYKFRLAAAQGTGIFNMEERTTAARKELELHAYAAALAQVLSARFD